MALKSGRPLVITRPLGRGRSSGVEHNLAKVRVGRSIRLARSKVNPVLLTSCTVVGSRLMHERPVVFGAPYSVYVRAVRLALEEKGVDYKLESVDIFAPGGVPSEHWLRHPFGKIPAFEHGGFHLYESGAITRYVDEEFPGPRLQPESPRHRARMNQIISVLDSYAYRTLVWDIFVERVLRPAKSEGSDEVRIAAALPRAVLCLSALSNLMGESPWLAGPQISLADLHAAPIFALFRRSPESERLLASEVRLERWWTRINSRPSFMRTE